MTDFDSWQKVEKKITMLQLVSSGSSQTVKNILFLFCHILNDKNLWEVSIDHLVQCDGYATDYCF